MTTQEIKDLIASKIAGQGSMVDVGGALPNILKEFADAMGNIPAPMPELDSIPNEGLAEDSIDVFQDATAIKVGGKVYVRNDCARRMENFADGMQSLQTQRGCTITEIGAIFCNMHTTNYNISAGRKDLMDGVVVLKCTPSQNPSALPLGIFEFDNY